jgi:choline dehydrogenase-like flavoprotein
VFVLTPRDSYHALALHRQGHADLQPVDRRASAKVGDTRHSCTFAPGSLKGGQIGEIEETPGLSASAWQMRPSSRGYVEAKSKRPGEAPAVNPRYLSKETDHRAIIGDLAA